MVVWVVLPLFNEAAAIGNLVDQIRAQSLSILVVDDGSTDDGAGIAQAHGAKVLAMGRNCGKGATLRKGFTYALDQPGWDVIVLMDSDGQHDPAEIPKLLNAHRAENADIVIGNRMAQPESMPWIRRVTNRLMSWVLSAFAGQKIPDSQCGFRSLKRKVVEELHLTCDRFEVESEILLAAAAKRFRIASVPIRTLYAGEPSRIRPVADTLRFFQLLLRYFFACPSSKKAAFVLN